VAHTNFPPGLSNVVAVEAGANYNLYLYEPRRAAPQCFARAPAPLSTTNATLQGTVVPNSRATQAWFEWGYTTAYGNTSPSLDAGSWITNSQISFPITNLLAATVYHCRIVSSNEAGIAYGADQIFRTGSKVSAWGFFDYSQTTIPPGLSNAVSISCGWNSSCALKTDGTVVAWGRNEYGQTNVPASVSNVIAIASGYGHNLALKPDGTVIAWGWNGYGQGTVPSGLSDVVALAAGDSHSLALKSDGSIVAWGWNTYGQTNQVAGLNNIVAIAAGATHNLALRPDGTVIVWGGNYNNQLSIPAGLSNAIAIAAGQSHSLALKRDGTVVAWGINNDNQISVPPGLSNVVSIAAAQWHSLAVRADGSVIWWGRNNYGQTTPPADLEFCVGLAGGENHTLALANRPPVAIPQTVPALFNQDTVLKLIGTDANADQLSFKISSLPAAGSLYQFTTNGRGAALSVPNTIITDDLGRVIFAPETNAIATPYTSFSFVANDGDSDSTSALVSLGIAILKPYAIAQPTTPLGNTAVTFNGVVTPNNSPTTAWFEWGETSSYGQASASLEVGNGVSPVRLNVATSNLTASANFHGRLVASNSIGITLGADFIFTTGEKVSAWGGLGDSVLKIPPGLSNTVALVAGDWHALALKANGTVAVWGTSPSGQTNTPAGLSNVIAIASSHLHNLALRGDGTIVGWGLNQNGQATPPAGLSNVIAITAGISNSFALKADGGVVAWGQNVFGETDVPPGLNGVIAIACGRHHVIALRHDGSLATWGNSDYGQTNIPPSATNIIAISAGDYHSLALRSDGRVIAWGANDSQQSTVPASLSNVVAIAGCGYYLNLALKSDGTMATWGSFTPLPAWTNVAGIAGEGAHNLALVNLPPVATPKTVAVPANFDSVITLSGTDTNTDLLSFKIVTLPAVGTLYQFTTNGRGSPILAPNAPVNDSVGRVWFAPEPNQFGNAYASFNFVANDGDVDSAAAQIQINVLATKPLAYTQASTPLSSTNVQIHGMILSGNLPAVAWFEWGTNSASEQSATPQPFPLNSGVTRISTTLSNLTPLVVYRYRIAASNVLGVSYGIEQRFTTGQRVTVWGQTLYGQTTIPAGLSNVVSIAGGVNQSCALTADGKAYSWGFHGTPNLVASNLTAVALGTDFGLGISNGTVIAWGYYQYQLPTPPAGLSNVIAIATGDFIGLALRSDGKVFMWGFGEFGQTPVPASATNVVAISSSRAHCLALRADGQIVGWGSNDYGQASPPSTLSNVVSVAAGRYHGLAVRSNGTVFAWGLNNFGQINVPASATNVIAVAAGDSHSLALRVDGSVVVWGNTAYGQTTIPAGLSNVVSIAAGAAQSLAIGNVKPTVLPRAFSGVANSDLLVTLSGSDTNSDMLAYRLANLPAAGKLYQYASGTRGTVMTNGDTLSDSQRRLIFAPDANAYGSPYTNFNYFADDGQLNSATSTVTLTIAAPIRPTITEITRTNHTSTRLTFTGHSNTTYCVWASTNLVTWEYLGLPTLSIAGTFQFLDSTPGDFAQRFYRISTGCETPPPQLQSNSALTGGGFDLRFSGGAYWTYRVWASTNLLYWEPIGTAVESQPGSFRFTDTVATNSPQRFYKAGTP
jgi:alpha-tubulin suppressor-like RCC1 family protein